MLQLRSKHAEPVITVVLSLIYGCVARNLREKLEARTLTSLFSLDSLCWLLSHIRSKFTGCQAFFCAVEQGWDMDLMIFLGARTSHSSLDRGNFCLCVHLNFCSI